jgi:lysophospholipase L1-like esterase
MTFVGSRSDYSNAIFDRAHEGWPGYVVRSFPSDPGPGQLFGTLTRKAMEANDPDVVLLMAGTNDLLRLERKAAGYTLPNILQSVDLLLGQILTAKPNVFVIVAPVVESPKIDACTLREFAGRAGCGELNESLKTIVDSYVQRGYRVSLASAMATAVPRDAAHFPDGIHPSGTGGYALVADVWLHAIEDITNADETSVAIGSTQHR